MGRLYIECIRTPLFLGFRIHFIKMLFSLFIFGFRVVDFLGYSDMAIFQESFLSEMLKCTPESNVAGTSGVTRLMLKKTVLFC